jgi:hypothetical protein
MQPCTATTVVFRTTQGGVRGLCFVVFHKKLGCNFRPSIIKCLYQIWEVAFDSIPEGYVHTIGTIHLLDLEVAIQWSLAVQIGSVMEASQPLPSSGCKIGIRGRNFCRLAPYIRNDSNARQKFGFHRLVRIRNPLVICQQSVGNLSRALSPVGNRVLSLSAGGSRHLWPIYTGAARATQRHDSPADCANGGRPAQR